MKHQIKGHPRSYIGPTPSSQECKELKFLKISELGGGVQNVLSIKGLQGKLPC